MLKRLVGVSLPVLCLVPALSAGIIYSNIGAGFPGDSPGHYGIDGRIWPFIGTTFTTTAGGELSSIVTDLSYPSGPMTPFTVGLYANASGQPGVSLESWNDVTVPGGSSCCPPVTTFTSVLHPLLTPGTQYWFVMSLRGKIVDWFENDQGVNGGIWFGSTVDDLSQGFATSATPGIQLDSVPEPSAGGLLIVGSLILYLRRTFACDR